MKTLNLKKKKFVGKKEIIVILTAIILTTVGIKASDKLLNQNIDQDNLSDSRCPKDMIFTPLSGGGFCIDKYENSAGPNCMVANPSNQEDTRLNLDIKNCKPVSVSGAVPWRYISQNQAAIACAKAGKRLPTNKEWLAAALGTPDKNANWNLNDCQVNANWSNQPGLSGSGSNCISAIGAFDMIGNLWEWVSDTAYEGKIGDKILPSSGYIKAVDADAVPSETENQFGDPNYNNDYFWTKNTGTRAFARGGYWKSGAEAGQFSVYLESPPSFAGNAIGFRCVK